MCCLTVNENSQVSEYVSLKHFNTLSLEAVGRFVYPLVSWKNVIDIIEFSYQKKIPLIPLGEGSNVVFDSYVNAVIMPVLIQGIKVKPYKDRVLITVNAGCNWHRTVQWTLMQGFYGLENLSLIPGTVGSAPVQNIGAYGVELSDFIVNITGYCLKKKQVVTLSKDECQFGYRTSIFKQSSQCQFIILSITLCLSLTFNPVLTYTGVEKKLSEYCQNKEPTGQDLSEVICNIRRSKIPDPKKIGNAGSFFKNPIVGKSQFEILKKKYPNIVTYNLDGFQYKISAAWLIQNCGFKGYREGNVGMHDHQALVLVNYGSATSADVKKIASMIQSKVSIKHNINLEVEPAWYFNKY